MTIRISESIVGVDWLQAKAALIADASATVAPPPRSFANSQHGDDNPTADR